MDRKRKAATETPKAVGVCEACMSVGEVVACVDGKVKFCLGCAGDEAFVGHIAEAFAKGILR
jgi:hypothetical protein